MARAWFGGTAADFAFSVANVNGNALLALQGANLLVFDPATGDRITDLLDENGAAIDSVAVPGDGQIPRFQGPDGLLSVKVGASETSARFLLSYYDADTLTTELRDDVIAGLGNDLARMRIEDGADWDALNPVLIEAGFGYDRDADRVKIGDGVTPWADLSFLGDGGGGTALNWQTVEASGGDDYATIQAALDAVPFEGGVVYFPGVEYSSSQELRPGHNTLLMGRATPRYQDGATTVGSTRISPLAGFTGAALIHPDETARGVGMVNMMLAGAGVGSDLHGVLQDAISGEFGWTVQNVQIEGFTGAGWYGSSHVGSFVNVHLSHNGVGLECPDGHRFVDTKWANVFVYFNLNAGIILEGSVGFFDVVNMRVERSGCDHANPSTPLNANAPGIRIKKINNSDWTNVSTDANTGPGFELIHSVAGRGGSVVDLQMTGCIFKRDAWGDGETNPNIAGVIVRGFGGSGADAAQHVRFVNCGTVVGNADDSGSIPYLSPAYGVEFQNTQDCVWIGAARGDVANWTFGDGNNGYVNFRPLIIDHFSGLHTVPDSLPVQANRIRGMVAFDSSAGQMVVTDSNLNLTPVSDDGGAGLPRMAVQAADVAVTDQAFVQTDLVVNIEFSKQYVIVVRGLYSGADPTSGIKCRLANEGGANFDSMSSVGIAYGVPGGPVVNTEVSSYVNVILTNDVEAIDTPYPFIIETTWIANGSGTVTLEFSNTSGQTATLLAGSTIECREVVTGA